VELVYQPFACALWLIKGGAAHHFARAFVADAHHQFAATSIGERTANPRRFARVKAVFRFLKLYMLAFRSDQQVFNGCVIIAHTSFLLTCLEPTLGTLRLKNGFEFVFCSFRDEKLVKR
jgi:hypothetical protein